jgi:phage shock protein PspC (stress-responsive transcriptional regulator)
MGFNKNITRNTDNTKIAGVCGAIADMFGINAEIVRIIYAAFTILTAVLPGVLLYLFLMLLIPKKMSTEQID